MKQKARNKRQTKSALLIIDMINDFAFPEGDKLFLQALPVARKVANLKKRITAAGLPVIYVNDNFQEWHDSFATTIETVERNSEKGKQIVDIIRPTPDDYYVLKPHRSGFYKTPLGVLLGDLSVGHLIITGVTTDICILFTAHDAYMRKFAVTVPSDCTVAVRDNYHKQALDLLKRNAYADTRIAARIHLK